MPGIVPTGLKPGPRDSQRRIDLSAHPDAMPSPNVRIVLVQPTHAGNVGSVARAMKNMGLESLYLVSPETDLAAPEARARTVGADDVLIGARLCASLDEALTGCRLVIGASARARKISWPTLEPRAAASKLARAAQRTPVALLFGQERMGLTNAELDYCHFLVTIPTDPGFSSLNLAAAVQIMAYEILLARDRPRWALPVPENLSSLATHEDRRRFYQHLETVLAEIEFFGSKSPRKLMRRLMRLFNRAQLDENEIHILRGILSAV